MIEVKRFVSISESPFDGDIFDTLAGGASYMETFAGGSMYNPLLLPQTNPKSIFKQYSIGRTLEMMGLQEDYVSLALLPIQLSDYLDDREIRVMTLVILDGLNQYVKAVYGGRGVTDSNGNIGTVSGGYTDLAGIAAEMSRDSGLEDGLEAAANAAYGPIGGIIAGSLYGAITGTGANIAGNVVEHTVSAFTGVIARAAVQGVAASLGITSSLGIMAAAAVIGYALKQAVEVALGLRSGFGIGGMLGDIGYGPHTATYSARLGFVEAAQQALGIKNFNTNFTTNAFGVITSYTSYDSQGRATTSTVHGWGIDPTAPAGQNTEESNGGLLGPNNLSNSYFNGSTYSGNSSSSNDDSSSNGGFGDDGSSSDSGTGEAGIGRDSPDGNDGGGGGDGGGSGGARHCCTVMVKHRLWRKKRLDDLGEWDKKQDILWRTGYQIGGKLVADFFNKKNRLPYYSKMMNAFYDTHILGKKRTIYTYQAYFFIYPIVYITGLYTLIKKIFQ